MVSRNAPAQRGWWEKFLPSPASSPVEHPRNNDAEEKIPTKPCWGNSGAVEKGFASVDS